MKAQAIALARVSTAEQLKSGSLSRQEAACRQAADELGVEVVKWWSGDVSSKSGKNVNRPDLLEALEFCKKHKGVRWIIVDEPDRLMRSIRELFYWQVRFENEANVRIHFAQNPELNKPGAIASLMLALQAFKGEGSNEERTGKSIRGHEKAVSDGRHTFTSPPGYTKGPVAGVKAWHPIEAEPWQQALKSIANGLATPREALDQLNRSDFVKAPTRTKRLADMGQTRGPMKWDKFKHHATSPFYAGVVVVSKQAKARSERGQHRAMITLEEHERILEAFFGKPRSEKHEVINPQFPMKRVVKCACNNGEFTGGITRNRFKAEYPKYRCRKCGKSPNRDDLHGALNALLSHVRLDKAYQEALTTSLTRIWKQRRSETIKRVDELKNVRQNLEQTKSNLMRAIGERPHLADDFEAEIVRIKSEMFKVDSDIKAALAEDDLAEFIRFAIHTINDLKSQWWDLEPEVRLRAKSLLFKTEILYDPDQKVCTAEISDILRLSSHCINTKNAALGDVYSMVELQGFEPWTSCMPCKRSTN